MKKTTTAMLALSGAVLLMGLGTGIANAATLVTYQSSGVIRTGTQLGPGKTLYSKDYVADGYGARSPWRNPGIAQSGVLDNNNGAGTTVPLTLPLQGTAYFKACIKNGATTIACSPEEHDTY
jgi:hypothetical protein